MARQPESSRGEGLVNDAQAPDPSERSASSVLPAGWSYVCLPSRNGSTCRAGTTTAYSWGNTIAPSNANYNASGINQTRDVGQYAANPWGFFDMHGNVWEWTADWYQAAYPTGNPVVDPTGPSSGSYRVVRGGSWLDDGPYLRSAAQRLPSGRPRPPPASVLVSASQGAMDGRLTDRRKNSGEESSARGGAGQTRRAEPALPSFTPPPIGAIVTPPRFSIPKRRTGRGARCSKTLPQYRAKAL